MSFEKLDALISKKMPVDYWEDDQLFLAQNTVSTFSESDWSTIIGCISEKNQEWKCRLIQAISNTANADNAIKIMIHCLENDDDLIAEVAIDNLRELIDKSSYSFSERQIEKIAAVRLKGGIAGRTAEVLLNKIRVRGLT